MYTFRWGCQHEDEAVKCYTDTAQKHHDGLEVLKAGFFIDVDKPYIGASPDRILDCQCCGRGVLEVKCPFCHRTELPDEEDKGFCMTKESGQWTLKRQHASIISCSYKCTYAGWHMLTLLCGQSQNMQLNTLQQAMNLSLPKWRPLQDFYLWNAT